MITVPRKGKGMPNYKLYRLDGAGQIARAPEQFDAADDHAAAVEADTRRCGSAAELWESRRLVRRFPGN